MALGGRCWLAKTLRSLLGDERGNAAIVFGLAVLPLLAGAGVATDTLLAYSVEDQLQKSLDAAGLAAGRTLDADDIEADAREFMRANFDAGPDLAELVGEIGVQISEDESRVTLTATAVMPTRIMHFFGQDTVTVNARTVVERQTRGMELALVLDITGSMVTDDKIGGLKVAANDLLNILYGERETVPDLWVGVVPYIASVNVGTGNLSFLASNDRARGAATAFAPDRWGGCVLARTAPRDQNDDPPSVSAFRSYLYPRLSSGPNPTWQWANLWPPVTSRIDRSAGVAYRVRTGPNSGCPAPITPLVAEKSTLVAAIDALVPEYRGGTITNEGIAWGWRTISPRWRGLWSGSPSTLPLAYGTENMDKAMVVMTDGDNQMVVTSFNSALISPYSTYESHTTLGRTTTSATQTELDRRTRAVCANVKAQGIILYTVTFGAVLSTTGQALMRDCATDAGHYFHAPNNASLRTAFQAIGSRLSNLRIAE